MLSYSTLARLFCPWDSASKNTRMGCLFLLQGIFPTQGSNLRLSGRFPALAGGFFTISATQGAWKMGIYPLALTFIRDPQQFHTNEAENKLLWIENQIWTVIPVFHQNAENFGCAFPSGRAKEARGTGNVGSPLP